MIIRAYTGNDALATWEIFYDAVHIGTAEHYTIAQRDAWVETGVMRPGWPDARASEDTLVADHDGRLLGFFSLKGPHVEMAFVRPEYRRTEVASDLYAALETLAREKDHIKLTTEASHLAKSFFLKRGWRIDQAKCVHARGVDIPNFDMSKNL